MGSSIAIELQQSGAVCHRQQRTYVKAWTWGESRLSTQSSIIHVPPFVTPPFPPSSAPRRSKSWRIPAPDQCFAARRLSAHHGGVQRSSPLRARALAGRGYHITQDACKRKAVGRCPALKVEDAGSASPLRSSTCSLLHESESTCMHRRWAHGHCGSLCTDSSSSSTSATPHSAIQTCPCHMPPSVCVCREGNEQGHTRVHIIRSRRVHHCTGCCCWPAVRAGKVLCLGVRRCFTSYS